MGELKLAPKDKRLRHPSLPLHLASLFLLSLSGPSASPFCLFCLSFSPQAFRRLSLSLLAFCLSFSPGLLLFSLSFSASLFSRLSGAAACAAAACAGEAELLAGEMGAWGCAAVCPGRVSFSSPRDRLCRREALPARGREGERSGKEGPAAGRETHGRRGGKKALPAGGRQGAVEKFIGGMESASAGAAYLKRRLPSSFVSASATAAVAFLPPLRMMA